jgi:hypothetical protein
MGRTVLVVAAFALIISGCAQQVVLRDPKTGQTVNCTLEGMKADRNPIGQVFAERGCIRSYRQAGYECVSGDCK